MFVSYPQKERNHPPIPLVITDIARDYGNSCNRLGEENLSKNRISLPDMKVSSYLVVISGSGSGSGSRTVENHSFHIIKGSCQK